VVSSWDVQLIIDRSVAGARGGEAFAVQPIVSAFDRKGVQKHVDMLGTMEAELYYYGSSSSAEEYERLPLTVFVPGHGGGGGKCTTVGKKDGDGDGDGDGADPITNPLVGGEATFENLCIDKAGDGYKIRYTLKDEYNISLGHVVGDAFNVSVGEAYQLGLIRQPHGVYGGIHWEVMPIVAVQDRGYNTITSVNNGTVSIALCVTPTADNNILISTRYSN